MDVGLIRHPYIRKNKAKKKQCRNLGKLWDNVEIFGGKPEKIVGKFRNFVGKGETLWYLRE